MNQSQQQQQQQQQHSFILNLFFLLVSMHLTLVSWRAFIFSDIIMCLVSLDFNIPFFQIQTVGYAATGFFPVLLTDPCVHAL